MEGLVRVWASAGILYHPHWLDGTCNGKCDPCLFIGRAEKRLLRMFSHRAQTVLSQRLMRRESAVQNRRASDAGRLWRASCAGCAYSESPHRRSRLWR
jgi:hypothetical protein